MVEGNSCDTFRVCVCRLESLSLSMLRRRVSLGRVSIPSTDASGDAELATPSFTPSAQLKTTFHIPHPTYHIPQSNNLHRQNAERERHTAAPLEGPSTRLRLTALSSTSSTRFFTGEASPGRGSSAEMFFRGDLKCMGEGDGLFASMGARARLAGEAIVIGGEDVYCCRWRGGDTEVETSLGGEVGDEGMSRVKERNVVVKTGRVGVVGCWACWAHV